MTHTATINGQTIEFAEGTSILDAARGAGIEIPTLCHHPDLSVAGSCRLCLVEVSWRHEPIPACAHPLQAGHSVETETPHLQSLRKQILKMLRWGYHASRSVPDEATLLRDPQWSFERWCRHYGVDDSVVLGEPRFPRDSDANPFLKVDLNQCILCTRCVRACAEVQGRFVWGLADRGHETHLVAGAGTSLLEARCESCGACSAYCPTGAISDRLSTHSPPPEKLVRTTCTYCGVGCQFDLNVAGDKVIRVTSTPEAPVNGMSLCVKGRYGYDFIHHPERLTRPMVRESLLTAGESQRGAGAARGVWVPVDWDTALDLVVRKFAAIREESGGDACALLASAKCSNEENYLVQKLARQLLGTHNVDHCARLCHSSTVAGLGMAYGSGAMSNSMDDIAEHAAALFVIGSNTTEQHPVFGAMLRQAVLQRQIPLIVADPRRVDLTEFATLHLQQRPGTDIALINGLMYLLLKAGQADERFIAERCEGFDEFRQVVEHYPPDRVAQITGVSESQLRQAAEILGQHRPTAVIWAMGITQHITGVMNVLALANLQMLLGNMGIPGGGVNPLRGQNNVQGACDMGALPNVFPGYQAVTLPQVRAKFESAWRVDPPVPALADRPGLTVTEMIGAAGSGQVRGLYILGENPVLTDPDSNHVRDCLSRAEFVVVQEIFPSATAEYADVLLPGTSFAERTGTYANTERRVQIFQQAISPVGDSQPDWWILTELGRRLMAIQGQTPAGPHAAWNYAGPESILDEVAALTPQYAGVNYARLRAGERLQWPVTSPSHPGTPILHVRQFTRGKGLFHAVEHLPPQELPDKEYPLLLTTGRVLYHWHGGEMTRRAQGLAEVYSQSLVEVSPEDAQRLGVQNGEPITLHSRRGTMHGIACISDRVASGIVFGNFHFPGDQNVNNLTIAALDPIAKIPEYKVCAVRLERP